MDASRHGYCWTIPKIFYFTVKMVHVLLLPVETRRAATPELRVAEGPEVIYLNFKYNYC